jgi:hypothetical protein
MAHGASTDDPSDRVEFSAYDIILEGSPLDWAVITRNRTLVHALLPHSKHHFGIQHALFHYYEIASDLLSEDTARAVLPPGYRNFPSPSPAPFSTGSPTDATAYWPYSGPSSYALVSV